MCLNVFVDRHLHVLKSAQKRSLKLYALSDIGINALYSVIYCFVVLYIK